MPNFNEPVRRYIVEDQQSPAKIIKLEGPSLKPHELFEQTYSFHMATMDVPRLLPPPTVTVPNANSACWGKTELKYLVIPIQIGTV
eukprot:gene23372-9644_t